MTSTVAERLAVLPPAVQHQLFTDAWADAASDTERARVLHLWRTATGVHMPLHTGNPSGYITDIAGGWLTSQQRRVADAVAEHRRVVVPAGHDLGKSWLAARIVTWWVETHPAGDALVLSTAPTFNQVKGILWKEIARAHVEGACQGRLNQTEWYLHTSLGVEERVAQGRKPADNSPGAFQGNHERYVLVVIDEADEVHPSMWEAIETVVTNEHSKVLAIGNPVWPTSEFAKVCHKAGAAPDWTTGRTDRGWWLERLDGLDSPNFTDEQVPERLRSLLLSPGWVDDYATKHGRDSMAFRSRVRGQHPTEQADGVVPLGWLRDRCQHWADPEGTELARVPQAATVLWPDHELTPWEMGIDVGAGGDLTVVTVRAGRRVVQWWTVQSRDPRDTHAVALEAAAWVAEQGAELAAIKIDVVGWGWGTYGSLLEDQDAGLLPAACQVVPVHVGMASTNPTRYKNLRSQLWWEVGRELAEQGVMDLSQLPDEHLLQLAEPRYTTDASGRIVVERKAETRARIGVSPDYADSLLLCFVTLPQDVGGYLLQDNHQPIT